MRKTIMLKCASSGGGAVEGAPPPPRLLVGGGPGLDPRCWGGGWGGGTPSLELPESESPSGYSEPPLPSSSSSLEGGERGIAPPSPYGGGGKGRWEGLARACANVQGRKGLWGGIKGRGGRLGGAFRAGLWDPPPL